MTRRFFIISFVMILASCKDTRVEVTTSYITNNSWTRENERVNANTLAIFRLKLKKDSLVDPYSKLIQEELVTKLEVDSQFQYQASVRIAEGESYRSKRVYFDRDNGFSWVNLYGDSGSYDSTRIIGSLRKNNWYKIYTTGLFSYSAIYIYVDSSNNIRRFNVNLLNI